MIPWLLALSLVLPGAALEGGGLAASHGELRPEQVAEQLDRILADPRFADRQPESLWERLRRQAGELFGRLLARLIEAVGGNVPAALIAAALIAGLAVLLIRALGRRRADDLARRQAIERILARGTDPAELERLADRAAADGDHAEAIRLRFVAGLLRLDEAGRIEFSPELTSHEVGELLGDPRFDRLAAQFDEVVYGRRPADAAGDRRAREGWIRVLEGARTA